MTTCCVMSVVRSSPEMEIPKILWLKKHLPASYDAAGHFFDLADYLSFRATGSTALHVHGHLQMEFPRP